jgi:hypothetical protein
LDTAEIAHGYAVEKDLDRLIERRHEQRVTDEGERAVEEVWAESARRHAHALRKAARAEWTLYHEHMSELHQRLAAEHREKAERLCEEPREENGRRTA